MSACTQTTRYAVLPLLTPDTHLIRAPASTDQASHPQRNTSVSCCCMHPAAPRPSATRGHPQSSKACQRFASSDKSVARCDRLTQIAARPPSLSASPLLFYRQPPQNRCGGRRRTTTPLCASSRRPPLRNSTPQVLINCHCGIAPSQRSGTSQLEKAGTTPGRSPLITAQPSAPSAARCHTGGAAPGPSGPHTP